MTGEGVYIRRWVENMQRDGPTRDGQMDTGGFM